MKTISKLLAILSILFSLPLLAQHNPPSGAPGKVWFDEADQEAESARIAHYEALVTKALMGQRGPLVELPSLFPQALVDYLNRYRREYNRAENAGAQLQATLRLSAGLRTVFDDTRRRGVLGEKGTLELLANYDLGVL